MKNPDRIRVSSGLAGLAGLALAILLIQSCGLPASITSERYALMIGISDYIFDDGTYLKDLSYPRSDAQEFGALLDKSGWSVDSSTLIDTNARKATIETTIKNYFKSLQPHASALIYYSGHGTAIGDEAYIVPSDYSNLSTSPLISMTEFSAWIKSYILPYTSNVIVIIDACNSGGFVTQSDSADMIDPDFNVYSSPSASSPALAGLGDIGELLAKNLKQEGELEPIVMSAAGFDELSWESGLLKHGVFTYYLMKAAESGDSNRDDFVSSTEAYTYAAKSIDKNWNNTYGNDNAFYPHISGGLRDLVLFDLH